MSRRKISYEGIYSPADFVTAEADTNLKALKNVSGITYVEGMAVVVSGDYKVGLGNSGEPIRGRIDKYEDDDNVTVQVGGHAPFTGVSGSLPSAGDSAVVNGEGKVVAAASKYIGGAKVVAIEPSALKVVVYLG